MTQKQFWKIFTGMLTLILLASACQPGEEPIIEVSVVETETPVPKTAPTETFIPSSTATMPPPRSLVICLGKEPSSLYYYGSSSQSSRSVLEAIYDGPFDIRDHQPQAVILEGIPSIEGGGAAFQAVQMQKGDTVVNIYGDLVALQAGVQVQPSGCSSAECVLTWDGTSELSMDQMVVDFALLAGVDWSDGQPVTAGDSVYSFKLAADRNTPVSKRLVNRTEAYLAVDSRHVKWVGVPGYFPNDLSSLFWLPLPAHILEIIPAKDLLASVEAARTPIGWGPYIIENWQDGDHIQLRKNPGYFRSKEGLPYFDDLVFRFLEDTGESLLPALLSKECDLIDQSTFLQEQIEEILQLQSEGTLKAYVGYGQEWEHLDFGILHSSNDDGYSAYYGDRPQFFADERTRQAFAYCIDRQGMVDDLFHGFSIVPISYLMPNDPWYTSEVTSYSFDIEKGRALLDQVGWKDWDANPETPLQAIGIPEIPDGTYFAVNYYASESPLRLDVANRIRDSLWSCGVQIETKLLSPEELYAPGPEGILFGRNFDLVQFSWQSGDISPCLFYMSTQVPEMSNNWLTLNVTGYSNPAFDSACTAAEVTRLDQAENKAALQMEVQKIFTNELPLIPLYFRINISLSRPDFCHYNIDVTSRSMFWNLEEFDYGSDCSETN